MTTSVSAAEHRFEHAVTAVIVANSMVMLASLVDHSHAELLEQVDIVCLWFFAAELSVRLAMARLGFFHNLWNTVDLVVVVVALLPIAGGGIAVLRLARLARTWHLLRHVTHLRLSRPARYGYHMLHGRRLVSVAALRSMRNAHGATMARRARTLLRGALQLAVLNTVLGTNPVRDVSAIKSKTKPKGAEALTADQLRDLLGTLRGSENCQRRDLLDPVAILIATGVRRSELLGLLWTNFDATNATLTVTGKVVRQHGNGLVRVDDTKTDAGRRTIPLPPFAVTVLTQRRKRPFIGEQPMIFASTTGTLRDPDNFGKQWRRAREDLGVPDITTHSFRKTLATLIDDAGLSARIGADQLGHAQVSMTQDRYMSRGRVHHQVADLLEQTVSDETPALNAD